MIDKIVYLLLFFLLNAIFLNNSFVIAAKSGNEPAFTPEQLSLMTEDELKLAIGKKGVKSYFDDYGIPEWEAEETRQRDKLVQYGTNTNSKEYLATLHELGRALYRLDKFEDAVIVADDVANWHGKVQGKESIHYGNALLNIASANFKLKNLDATKLAILRSLKIMNDVHGEGSRESTQVFGKIVQWHLYDSSVLQGMTGITQEQYENKDLSSIETNKKKKKKKKKKKVKAGSITPDNEL